MVCQIACTTRAVGWSHGAASDGSRHDGDRGHDLFLRLVMRRSSPRRKV